MTDQSFQFPRFYVTAPSPCPYLADREERKVFTELDGPDATELNEALGRVGFRRSQAVAYRPACDGCNACISVRVLAEEFRPSRNMKRVLKANRDVEVSAMDACATHEQYFILQKYLMLRHAEGGMTRMDEFEYSEMLESSPVTTTVVEYRVKASSRDGGEPDQLLGVALTDALSDGLSMVYSFFDPDEAARSLGTFIILDHIQRARTAGLPHVYLGYWVEGSAKMDYKRRFKPIEMLGSMGWAKLESGTDQPGARE